MNTNTNYGYNYSLPHAQNRPNAGFYDFTQPQSDQQQQQQMMNQFGQMNLNPQQNNPNQGQNFPGNFPGGYNYTYK